MLDFGVNTKKATRFVQIRDIFEDPNEVQFWLQAGYGTRFQDIHPKVFQINEFTNEGVDLAGDYVTGAALTVTIEDIAGYTKPADVKVTVADGEDFTASGTYTKS